MTLLTVVGVLALAVPAWASTFTDVTRGSTHARAIAAIRDAGVTIGCAAGADRFCPRDEVTREQMASFLARSGSAAAADRSATTLAAGSGNVNGVAAVVSLEGPGASPGRQHVVLSGTVTVHRSGTTADCPCEVQAFVYRARDGRQGPSSWAEFHGAATASGTSSVALPVSWAVPIDAGRDEEYRLAVFVDGTVVSGFAADGALQAITAPYGTVPAG